MINDYTKKYEWYQGKSRDILQLSETILALVQTNRQSAFDKHICNIPDKGYILTQTSAWWFNKIISQSICNTHYLYNQDNIMFVNPCRPIPLEIIVRGYITGNTSTSMWINYQKGAKEYCGIPLKSYYTKNEKLDTPIVTPTTKGKTDLLISPLEIIEKNILSSLEWEIISKIALRLYEYGTEEAAKKGLILVDTKYEFGFDENDNIVLIDEVHTCDSSRYWKLDSYKSRFELGLDPEKYDKDIVRYWIKENLQQGSKIPEKLINDTSLTYSDFYKKLTEHTIEEYTYFDLDTINFNIWLNAEQYLREIASKFFPSCIIISGSESDSEHCDNIIKHFNEYIIYNTYVCSAHKNTRKLLRLLKRINTNKNTIFITVAGMSNALSGVVACNTILPVIACPHFKDNIDMSMNINSSLMCPSNVPVMTVISPLNAASCVQRILALY